MKEEKSHTDKQEMFKVIMNNCTPTTNLEKFSKTESKKKKKWKYKKNKYL